VSKRHQSSRRRSYGRRQHEIHERDGNRRQGQATDELDLDGFGASSESDPLRFHDAAPLPQRTQYAFGD
jgi:hypothetical protein